MATENVQDVMQDLLAIRRSIQTFENNKAQSIVQSSYVANMKLQITAIVLAGIMLLIELFGEQLLTQTMLTKNDQEFWRILGVVCLGAFLIVCVLNMYAVIKKSASKVQDEFDSYVKRHFHYLKSLTHISDLAAKFLVIAALIWAQRPEYVAPFLFIFTGDYLFQGRLFTIKMGVTQILAIASFLLGGLVFWLGKPELMYPLLWFFFVNGISVFQLRKMKRVED